MQGAGLARYWLQGSCVSLTGGLPGAGPGAWGGWGCDSRVGEHTLSRSSVPALQTTPRPYLAAAADGLCLPGASSEARLEPLNPRCTRAQRRPLPGAFANTAHRCPGHPHARECQRTETRECGHTQRPARRGWWGEASILTLQHSRAWCPLSRPRDSGLEGAAEAPQGHAAWSR